MIPMLVDTHTHTTFSCHAYATHLEMTRQAAERGLQIIFNTDHGPTMPGCDHPLYFECMHDLLGRHQCGILLFRGAEANIVGPKGELDVSEQARRSLDYVMASFHIPTFAPLDIEGNTQAMCAALRSPGVDAVAHPDAPSHPMDVEAFMRTMRDTGAFLEINNHSFQIGRSQPETAKRMLKLAKKWDVPVVLGTDAHFIDAVGLFDEAVAFLHEADYPEEWVLNADPKRFIEALKAHGRLKDLD